MPCQEETIVVATVVNGQDAIKVVRDDIDTSPREWDNLGVISMRADGNENYSGYAEETYRLYGCEDETGRPDKCGDAIFGGTLAHIPLFFDNWGWKTVIRTAPNERGEVPDGYIYATDKRAVYMGCVSKKTGKPSARMAKRMLRYEIASLNQWLAGEVYMVSLERTKRCEMGTDHVEVLECIGGVYPPYNGNIDEDGRCAYYNMFDKAGRVNPADHAVRTFIEDFVWDARAGDKAEADDGGGEPEALGWYRAAAACADLSEAARAYWSGEAEKMASRAVRPAASAPAAPRSGAGGKGRRA